MPPRVGDKLSAKHALDQSPLKGHGGLGAGTARPGQGTVWGLHQGGNGRVRPPSPPEHARKNSRSGRTLARGRSLPFGSNDPQVPEIPLLSCSPVPPDVLGLARREMFVQNFKNHAGNLQRIKHFRADNVCVNLLQKLLA